MANWDKILGRGNVEDRRGQRSTLAFGGGLGVTGIAILLIVNYLGGGDVTDVLSQLSSQQVVSEETYSEEFAGADSYEVFAGAVLGSSNEMWGTFFAQNNMTYTPPKLVLFRTLTPSSCGGADSRAGPHYCPLDSTIYLDETFFDEMTARFGAKGGDVAEAYVIAHEVGHHVQNELGLLGDSVSEVDSIAQELQADCFAGLWAYSIKDLGVLEFGEISEALDAAAAVGDDRIQKTTTGRVNPESWTHGSSADRVSWFNKGFETGSVNECSTS